jgi:hypothetical protein
MIVFIQIHPRASINNQMRTQQCENLHYTILNIRTTMMGLDRG